MSKQERQGHGTIYQIQIEGRLHQQWADWFGGMAVAVEERNDGPPITTLTGRIADQAALRGVLNQIFDLNLTLISVQPAGGVVNEPFDQPKQHKKEA
jgi:hypothetical protein